MQGGGDRQHRVFDSIVHALKWIFPLLPKEAKDLVSVKKLVAREGYWECVKEVLGWIIDTEAGAVAHPEHKLQELRDLLDILISQRRMGRKELEQLVGKLRSMHLSVPGAVAHLYHIHRALAQVKTDRDWLSPIFHCKIADWKNDGGLEIWLNHSPCRYCLSRTHPSGVLRRLRTRGRGSVARSVSLGEGSGVAPPLAGRHHFRPRIVHKQGGDDHQL